MSFRVFLSTVAIMGVTAYASPAIAQVRSDGSLPTSVTSTNGRDFQIGGGAKRGTNVFHSFDAFSIPDNGSALFTESRNGVRNIIGRVTGDRPSLINGVIRTSNGANLFLINPNGMVIGTNARLDIRGSFLASTAESLIFQDGTAFSATDSSPPLLTASIPVGLQMGANPGGISINTPDFALPPDQDVVFVGSPMTLNGVDADDLDSNLQLGSFSPTEGVAIDVGLQTLDLLSVGSEPTTVEEAPMPNPDEGIPDNNQDIERGNPNRSDPETPGIQDPDIPLGESDPDDAPAIDSPTHDAPTDPSLTDTPFGNLLPGDRVTPTLGGSNPEVVRMLAIALQTIGEFSDDLSIQENVSALASSTLGRQVSAANRSEGEEIQETVATVAVLRRSTWQEMMPTCLPTSSNTFLISGRGSLPETPASALGGGAIWRDIRILSPSHPLMPDATSLPVPRSDSPHQFGDDRAAPHAEHPPIVEARGWVVTETGQIILVAPGHPENGIGEQTAQHRASSHADIPC